MTRTMPGLAVLIGLCLLSGPALAETTPDDKVLVLNTAFSEPISNKEQTGFADTLIGMALQRLGYRLKTLHLPAERALIIANDGIDDGEMLRIAGLQKSYPNLIQVPEKIIDLEFSAFTRKKSLPITGWHDLAAYPVAIITGWKILERNIPATIDLVTVRNVDQLFTLLLKDRTDAILYTRWSGLAYIRKHQLQGISIVEPPLERKSMYVYLHKRHRELVPRLAHELRLLKAEGEKQRLFREILAPYAGD